MLCLAVVSWKRVKETVGMGWSEQYWEDEKSELEQPAPEPGSTSEDETQCQPATGRPADMYCAKSTRDRRRVFGFAPSTSDEAKS